MERYERSTRLTKLSTENSALPELATSDRLPLEPASDMVAVVPVDTVNALVHRALQTAYGISRRIHVVHVKRENSPSDFVSEWDCSVRGSIESAGLPQPELVVLESLHIGK